MSSELLEQYQLLLKKSIKTAELLSESENPVGILLFPTMDNLCAASIIMSGLWHKEHPSHISIVESKEELFELLNTMTYTHYCVIGNTTNFYEEFKIFNDTDKTLVLIDYHLSKQDQEVIETEKILPLSGKIFGIPEDFISNAGLSYLITKGWMDDYQYLSSLALLGAIDEKQFDKNKLEFIGLNRKILEEAKISNIISVKKTTRLLGRESRPIYLSLKYSFDPVLIGLTGNENACLNFLSRIGIQMKDQENNWRTISDLSIDEIKILNDHLVSLLSKEGELSPAEVNRIIGPVYIILNEKKHSPLRNLEDFYRIIFNAVKLKNYDLIISVLLGDRAEDLQKLTKIVDETSSTERNFTDRLANKDKSILSENDYYVIIDGSELDDIKLAKLILLSLIKGETLEYNKPLIVYVKKRKYLYVYIHEPKTHIEKGFLLYHHIAQAHKKGLIDKISGTPQRFEIKVKKENFEEILNIITEALEYHYLGEKKEKNEQNDTKVKGKALSKGNNKRKTESNEEKLVDAKEKTSKTSKEGEKGKKKINLLEFINENDE